MMAKYIAVKDDLLSKIQDETYPEGELIPSELELAKEYNVSRSTIRQALRILQARGYLNRRRRRGTVVSKANPHAEEETAQARTHDDFANIGRWAEATGKAMMTTPIVVRSTHATSKIAEALGVRPGDEVYKIVRLRYLGAEPNLFVESYVPASLYPNFLDDVDFSKVRMHDHMRDAGRPIKEQRNQVNIAVADKVMATLLDIAVGSPIYVFHITGFDVEGNIIEYSISSYRGTNTFEFTVVRSIMMSNEELLG